MLSRILLLFAAPLMAQTSIGSPAPQWFAVGPPSASYPCNTSSVGFSYFDIGPNSGGRLYVCDTASGTLAWDHLLAPIAAVTSATQITGSIVGPGCNSIVVTVPGAMPGVNGAFATPLTDPGSKFVTFTAAVTAANTVSVNECVFGVLSLTPTSTYVRVLVY